MKIRILTPRNPPGDQYCQYLQEERDQKLRKTNKREKLEKLFFFQNNWIIEGFRLGGM
jgi:hypothetical protein